LNVAFHKKLKLAEGSSLRHIVIDMMMTQLLIGCLMIGLTVVIHAVALDRLVSLLEKLGPLSFRYFKKSWEVPLMVITVLGVFLTHIVQIWIWALLFLYLEPNILPDLESALYFSTSAFTTVGFGDVFLDQKWRLLSSFESANGFILFGWSTAFIFEIISKLYKDEHIKKIK
jgi:hypothetical protein